MATRRMAVMKKEEKAFTFLYEDLKLTAVEHMAIRKMALIAVDPEDRALYSTTKALATKVGVGEERVKILRLTPEYRTALGQAMRLTAMEAQAASIAAIRGQAESGDPEMDSVQAFRALGKLGGMDAEPAQMPQQVNIQQNNVYTLEQRILGRLTERLHEVTPVIDVKPEGEG